MPPKQPKQLKSQKIDLHEPVPATLVRRIAEAVDGYRGKPNWFVFSTDDEPTSTGGKRPHVSPGYNESQANAQLGTNKKRHRIGPFFTPSWATERTRDLTMLWVQTSTDLPGTDPFMLERFAELDSLFWTESSIDKFLVPYYVRIFGWEYGDDIQSAFDEPDVFALTHLPGSEYVAKIETGSRGEITQIAEITPGYAARKRAAAAGTPAPGAATPEGADGES